MSSEFPLNSLKGRLSEHLVQDLFANNGYNVFNYGLERTHPFLSKEMRNNFHTTSKELRFMQDFVVQSSLTAKLFYLGVKYRSNVCF